METHYKIYVKQNKNIKTSFSAVGNLVSLCSGDIKPLRHFSFSMTTSTLTWCNLKTVEMKYDMKLETCENDIPPLALSGHFGGESRSLFTLKHRNKTKMATSVLHPLWVGKQTCASQSTSGKEWTKTIVITLLNLKPLNLHLVHLHCRAKLTICLFSYIFFSDSAREI